jgi:hypothetical protein
MRREQMERWNGLNPSEDPIPVLPDLTDDFLGSKNSPRVD